MKNTIKNIISVISAAAILGSNAVAVSADSVNPNMISSASIYSVGAKKPAQVVVNKKYSSTKTAVRISWGKVTKASGYRVYIYDRTSKTWEKFKTIRGRATTNCRINGLKPGTKYKFRVRAYRKLNGKTYWGKTSAVKNTVTAPKTTKLKVSETSYNDVTISWTKVKCSKYTIQQEIDGKWKNLIAVNNAETSYKITGLSEGTQYGFRLKITARDADKNITKTSYSNFVTPATKKDKENPKPDPDYPYKKYDIIYEDPSKSFGGGNFNYWYAVIYDIDGDTVSDLDACNLITFLDYEYSQEGVNEAFYYASDLLKNGEIEIFKKGDLNQEDHTGEFYIYIGF